MLTHAPVSPVLPITDVERARRFYEETLGLANVTPPRMKNALMFEAGKGTVLVLYQRPAATVEHTQAGFLVDNIEQTVQALRGKGIVFEDYDLPDLKTVDGIATTHNDKAAWFKDSEGNILVISQIL